jgi:hypothetical protein
MLTINIIIRKIKKKERIKEIGLDFELIPKMGGNPK